MQLAAVGRGRALLDSGAFDGAAAAVASVSSTFSYQVSLAAPSAGNDIGVDTYQTMQVSVSDQEGTNGLNFASAADPRVTVQVVGTGSNGNTIVAFTAYSPASPIALATGNEAALIVAEAALRRGDLQRWAQTLNTLRASFAMDSLPNDSTVNASPDERLSVMFRERAFSLFGTGHRLGDLRRLVRQYGRSIEQTYPTGLYEGGPSSYGSATEFVVEAAEGGPDPTYHGCFDAKP
jgi:hypothetical protein